MCRALLRCVPGLIACTFAPGAASAIELTLSLGTLEAPNFRATAVKTSIGDKVFRLAAGEVVIIGRTFRNVNVTCGTFRFEPERVECRDGVLETGGSKMPVAFLWHPKTQALELTAVPQPKETWRLEAKTLGATRRSQVDVANGSLANLAGWIPGGLPRTSAGTFEGRFVVDSSSEQSLWGQVTVRGAAFSDASGAHAGEKLDAVVRFFAQPVGGGVAVERHARVDRRRGVLAARLSARHRPGAARRGPVRCAAHRCSPCVSEAARHRRAGGCRGGLGPLGGARAEREPAARGASTPRRSTSRCSSRISPAPRLPICKVAGALEVASLRMRDAEMEAVDIVVRDLTFEDRARPLRGLRGERTSAVASQRGDPARPAHQGGEALKIPFGAMKLPLAMRGMRFRLEQTEIPVLDGKLIVKGFASDPPGDEDWRWAFSGALAPMSMERFTQAVGWPVMHGVIAAQIPRVSFSRSTLRVGGAFIFKVFDGTVEMRNISLADPFGKAPRLTADLDMKQLDLDLLTRTFSFGNMKGRVDAEVIGMELSNWRPVRFDVRVKSSPGDYPRKISQKAVENITALGGASAAAAAQRMFLRFFQQFDYETLGWSCRLEKGVCRMGGVENTANGYVIVKGSGVPALSVLGYNRDVNWEVLVERVKRVAADNVRAVVQ